MVSYCCFWLAIYSGSSGLAQLLNRPDIDACIVDVHPGVFVSSHIRSVCLDISPLVIITFNLNPRRYYAFDVIMRSTLYRKPKPFSLLLQASIASKVWAAGKHLFSRSPISLSSQTAYQTIQKFIVLDKFPPGMVAQFPNRLLWNVATSAEYEEAFVEVSPHAYVS